jgi:thiamine biosynthesis lipoprotein
MSAKSFQVISVISTFMLIGCQEPKTLQKFEGETQGTTYHISFWSPTKAIATSDLKTLVDDELKRIDAEISNYRQDSVIEQFNANQSTAPQLLSEEIVKLISAAREVSVASRGCYDLTIKPLFDLWGFKGDKLNKPTQDTLTQTLRQVGFEQLEILGSNQVRKHNPKVSIDLSSVGQGYSVAKIATMFDEQGIENYLIEIGGELQIRGKKPDQQQWRVALEKPISEERSLHKIITVDGAEPLGITTSGTYRHFFDEEGKRYSHILDAHTGMPVSHQTVSVTVFNKSAMTAEVWDTALLCLGREEGVKVANQAGIAALFIEQQGDNTFNAVSTTALDDLKNLRMENKN